MNRSLYERVNDIDNPFTLREARFLDLVITDDCIVIRFAISIYRNRKLFHYKKPKHDSFYIMDLRISDYELNQIRFTGSDIWSYDRYMYLRLTKNSFTFKVKDIENEFNRIDLILGGKASNIEWILLGEMNEEAIADNDSDTRILRRRNEYYYGEHEECWHRTIK